MEELERKTTLGIRNISTGLWIMQLEGAATINVDASILTEGWVRIEVCIVEIILESSSLQMSKQFKHGCDTN